MDTLERFISQNYKIKKSNFIYLLVKNQYTDFGILAVDSIVLFKMIFINIIFEIGSMRINCEKTGKFDISLISGNLNR